MTELPVVRQPDPAPYIFDRERDALEKNLEQYMGERCVLADSAVDGLGLALIACGVEAGDFVVCTALAHGSILQAIRNVGAVPVFSDINPNTFNLDPYCLEYVVRRMAREKKPLPKAVIAADLFGLPCNYTAIGEICETWGLCLIEDMSGAFSATHRGKRAGSFGRFSVASFFAENPFGDIGDDGVIFCRSQEDQKRIRSLVRQRAVQQSLFGADAERDLISDRARHIVLSELMKTWESETARRREICGWYREALSGLVRFQETGPGFESACTQFAVVMREPQERAPVIDHLLAEHIPCSIWYPVPLHLKTQPPAGGRPILVNAEQLSQRLLTLPLHPYLNKSAVGHICGCLAEKLINHASA